MRLFRDGVVVAEIGAGEVEKMFAHLGVEEPDQSKLAGELVESLNKMGDSGDSTKKVDSAKSMHQNELSQKGE